MENSLKTELLVPAKNSEFGITTINHGADAVYIGAPNFGARKLAGNQISEMARLIGYAHVYHARVYATLNTILWDHELEIARALIYELYQSGIDGIIIQDMGLLEMDLPPVPLIASTQTHNTTVDKVRFLEHVGYVS